MRFWFLDVVKNTFGVPVRHDATKVGSGIVAQSGAENDCFSILVIEELQHVVEGKRAADIGIQHEESPWLALENSISEVIQTSCSAKCLIFSQILNLDLREFLGRVFDEVPEDAFVVVADKDDFFHTLDLFKGFQVVPDDRVASNIKKWLGILSIRRPKHPSVTYLRCV